MIAAWLLLQAVAAAPAPSDPRFDLRATVARTAEPVTTDCPVRSASKEIIVCAGRRPSYRLPLREPRPAGARVAGEARSAADTMAGSGPCGIFAGQRRCTSKAEAAEFGYGGGRDPITLAGKIVGAIAGRD